MTNETAGIEAEDDGPEIIEVAAEYLFLHSDDERLRAWIVEELADITVAHEYMVQNMEAIFQWIKKGTVPDLPAEKSAKSRGRGL